MIAREEALELVKSNVANKNLINHMLAAEFIMRALAERFTQDPEKWGLAGLLHDIDYDSTYTDMQKHSKVGAQMLKEAGVAEDICHAVLVHNDAHGVPRESMMDKALHAVDPLTGLIVAAALVMPGKKLGDIRKNPQQVQGEGLRQGSQQGADQDMFRHGHQPGGVREHRPRGHAAESRRDRAIIKRGTM